MTILILEPQLVQLFLASKSDADLNCHLGPAYYPLWNIIPPLEKPGKTEEDVAELRKLLGAPDLSATDFATAIKGIDWNDTVTCPDTGCDGTAPLDIEDIPCDMRPNGTLPTDTCYPHIETESVTSPQAWGVTTERESAWNLVPNVDRTKFATDICPSAITALCTLLEAHDSEAAYQGVWVWGLGTVGPGCLVGAFLPPINHVRYPTKDECVMFLTEMSTTLASRQHLRATMNIVQPPTVPIAIHAAPGSGAGIGPPAQDGQSVDSSIGNFFVSA